MLAILIVVSITRLGPIIFMRLSEKTVGEYDGIFSSSKSTVNDFSDWEESSYSLNYVRVKQLMEQSDKDYNLSPRLQFCGSAANY